MATLRVIDAQTGTPLGGVRLSLRPGLPPEVTTDDGGNATVLLIPFFPTRVTISRPGFPDQTSTISGGLLPGATIRVPVSRAIGAPPLPAGPPGTQIVVQAPPAAPAPSIAITLQQQSAQQSEELFSLLALIGEQQSQEDRLRSDLDSAIAALTEEQDGRQAAEERAEAERLQLQELIDAVRAGLDVSQEELRLARERVAQADRDTEDARKREEDARVRADELTGQIGSLTSSIAELSSRIGGLQEQLSKSKEEQAAALEEQRESLQSAFDDALASQLEEQAEAFRKQLEELQRQIEELELEPPPPEPPPVLPPEPPPPRPEDIVLDATVGASPFAVTQGTPVDVEIRIF